MDALSSIRTGDLPDEFKSSTFYVVDGMHRVKALQNLMEENHPGRLAAGYDVATFSKVPAYVVNPSELGSKVDVALLAKTLNDIGHKLVNQTFCDEVTFLKKLWKELGKNKKLWKKLGKTKGKTLTAGVVAQAFCEEMAHADVDTKRGKGTKRMKRAKVQLQLTCGCLLCLMPPFHLELHLAATHLAEPLDAEGQRGAQPQG